MNMSHRVTLKRGMDGVHWRFDSEEGLLLGETIGVRILQQVNHSHALPCLATGAAGKTDKRHLF